MGKQGNNIEGSAPTSNGERRTPAHVNANVHTGQVIDTSKLTVAERVAITRTIVSKDPAVIADLWALCRVDTTYHDSTNDDSAQLPELPISRGA